jgi:histidyl-tRNA synthetase
MSKVSLPQGFRDFTATTIFKRNYILQTIKHVFGLYGFEPLETPAMENLESLMGKYGEEGDRLIFKVLNNGLNDAKNTEKAKEGFAKVLEGRNSSLLTERALKYDLTIPFARFVAMNANTLTMPYKRYQVQPVWRADRPQRGRYREFTQCDADVVGSASLINEIDFCNIFDTAFKKLKLNDYTLKINSRKILQGLAEHTAGIEKMVDITVAIDKLDKIGIEKVQAELELKGVAANHISIISDYLAITGSNQQKIESIKKLLGTNSNATAGIAEIEFVLAEANGTNIEVDFTLARGLNYYTGIIFEVKAPEKVKIGSIAGGGRYDNLTELFGVPNICGVGISFGIDRIFDVLEELQLFPENVNQVAKAIFFNMGETTLPTSLQLAQQARNHNISCEVYTEKVKLDKQFKYAEKKGISYAIIIGETELAENAVVVKKLNDGTQQKLQQQDLIAYLGNN